MHHEAMEESLWLVVARYRNECTRHRLLWERRACVQQSWESPHRAHRHVSVQSAHELESTTNHESHRCSKVERVVLILARTLPRLCEASVWNSTEGERRRQMAAISLRGCKVPTSLLACMMVTSTVSLVIDRSSSCKSTHPFCAAIVSSNEIVLLTLLARERERESWLSSSYVIDSNKSNEYFISFLQERQGLQDGRMLDGTAYDMDRSMTLVGLLLPLQLDCPNHSLFEWCHRIATWTPAIGLSDWFIGPAVWWVTGSYFEDVVVGFGAATRESAGRDRQSVSQPVRQLVGSDSIGTHRISLGEQPINDATRDRARTMASRGSRPNTWPLEALPKWW